MEFVLEKWGDGTIRLCHWDSLHGEDVIFVLNADGSVERDDNDKRLLVTNLCKELLRTLEQRKSS